MLWILTLSCYGNIGVFWVNLCHNSPIQILQAIVGATFPLHNTSLTYSNTGSYKKPGGKFWSFSSILWLPSCLEPRLQACSQQYLGRSYPSCHPSFPMALPNHLRSKISRVGIRPTGGVVFSTFSLTVEVGYVLSFWKNYKLPLVYDISFTKKYDEETHSAWQKTLLNFKRNVQ